MSRAAFLRGLSGPQLPTSALQAVEAFDQKLDAISRERFQPAREAELRAAALDELQRTLRTERDRALSALEAADEKAEAQALAAARDRLPTSPDDSQNFTMRQVASLTHTLRKSVDTQLDVTLIGGAAVAEVVELFEDALLTQDGTRIRRLALSAQQRLRVLEQAERAKHKGDSSFVAEATLALSRLSQQLADWRRAHPSPRERLDAVRAQRGTAAQLLGQAFEVAAGLCAKDHLPGVRRVG